MKNNKFKTVVMTVSIIGAIASVARLIIELINIKSKKTDEVLDCNCCGCNGIDYDDFVVPQDMYDQAEEGDLTEGSEDE
jgi:hypothetical protein